MALTWTLKLKDHLSSAANAGSRALGRLESALNGVKRADDRMSRQGSSATARLERDANRQAAAYKKLASQRQQFASGGASSGGGIGVAGVAAGAAIGGAILSVGSALASRGVELGQRMFEGAQLRQGIEAGLSALVGGADKARSVFDAIAAKSAEIGAPLLDTAKQVQSLLAGGFKLEGDTGAMRILEATRALKFINPTANVDNVVMALAQIQSKGKLMAEELHGQLGDAGINIGRVYEALAAKLGKKTDDIRKLMQKGAISAADGIAAVFTSIEKTGGKSISELAKSGSRNFASLWERVKALPEEMGAKMKLGGAIETLSGALEKVIARAGELDLSTVFERVATTISRIIGMATKIDLVPFLEKASTSVDKLVSVAERANLPELISAWSDSVAGNLVSGFADGFASMADALSQMSPQDIRDMGHAFAMLGKVLGGATAGFIALSAMMHKVHPVLRLTKALAEQLTDLSNLDLGGAFTRMASGLAELGLSLGAASFGIALPDLDVEGWIGGAVDSATAAASGLGSAIIDGVVEGITAGAESIGSALSGLAKGAIDAAASAVGAHSPATLPRDRIGIPIGQGATLGIEREAPNAARALGELAAGGVNSAADIGRRAGTLVGVSIAAQGRGSAPNVMRVEGMQVQAIDQQLIADGALEMLRSVVRRQDGGRANA